MTTTDTSAASTPASDPASTSASGAPTDEWRDTPHDPGDSAPPALEPGRRGRRELGALVALLAGTALLYLWDLGQSGDANSFYAAAVQAGTKSWKAMFFGSFDSSNFITVDKPPASLWPMEIAGRIFGFNSWSMLVPEAIEGVLSVWLLYATVRRWFGPTAGLLAGTLLALTPVAVLMFRFNNPDALMTLLIVAAAYCVTRAIEVASTRWLLLAGAALGFAFLAKGLQPFTVIPALAVAYLVAAPTGLRRRILQLLAAGGAVIAGAGWWVLAVQLTPAADRPYIGGSGNNSVLGLAFGYNGLGRITGNESTSGTGGGAGGGGGGGANFDGSTGITRMFNSINGGQIAWLLPAALLAIVALIVVTRRRARTDRTRAALIIFGGWLLVTAGVLSFASGIIHSYYTVELAPAIAAVVAIGAVTLWRERAQLPARVGLAVGAIVTGWWSYTLLHRSSGWHPWVADLVLAAAVVAAVAVLIPVTRFVYGSVIAIIAGLVALTGGSAAYALNTAATPHTSGTPSAGPTVTSSAGGFGGGFGGRTGALPEGFEIPAGGFTGGGAPSGQIPTGGFSGAGGAGGPGGSQTANPALAALLKKTTTKWAAAIVGSQSAAPLELSSGKAVMAIGGFSGSDAAPTLAQFKALVAKGEIHYYIGGGVGASAGGGSGTSAIGTWVAAHYTSSTVGGTTVYDLTKAKS